MPLIINCMKLQHLIASVIAFIVVLLVGMMAIYTIIMQLSPAADIPTIKGISTVIGFILAIIAAWYAGKMSAKMQTPEK